MRISRKALVAAGVIGVAGSGAVAMAATNQSTAGQSKPAHERPDRRALGPIRADADTRAVLDAVRKAVLEQAPGIVQPILDQAVKDGKLTQAQADTAEQALADLKAGKRPSADALALLRDEQARAVVRQATQAVAKQAPTIAGPIVDQAVKDGKLTQAEGDRLKQRLQAIADRAAAGRGGPGAGPWRGRGHGPGFGHAGSAAQAAVLADVAKAIAKQAPTIAAPIIDQAVKDGKLTQAEADELKERIAERAKRAGG